MRQAERRADTAEATALASPGDAALGSPTKRGALRRAEAKVESLQAELEAARDELERSAAELESLRTAEAAREERGHVTEAEAEAEAELLAAREEMDAVRARELGLHYQLEEALEREAALQAQVAQLLDASPPPLADGLVAGTVGTLAAAAVRVDEVTFPDSISTAFSCHFLALLVCRFALATAKIASAANSAALMADPVVFSHFIPGLRG